MPKNSRRLKPFVDHIFLFSILDNKVWFRNYQASSHPPIPTIRSSNNG